MISTGYRYALMSQPEGRTQKFDCPGCQGKKTFVRYMDTELGEWLPDEFGKCDRSNNCGYHLDPYNEGYKPDDHEIYFKPRQAIKTPPPLVKPSFIPFEFVTASKKGLESNSFVKYLTSIKGVSYNHAFDVCDKYHVGTFREHSCKDDDDKTITERFGPIFWQVDINGNVRTGRLMSYKDGHRVKGFYGFAQYPLINRGLIPNDFNCVQCFTGEHLLKEFPNAPVCVVEAQKTAIVASLFFPSFVWISADTDNGVSGDFNTISGRKTEVLKGRDVTLWPDIGPAFEKWSEKAEEVNQNKGYNFKVSNFLENNFESFGLKVGDDLADYLEKLDASEFRFNDVELNESGYPGSWDIEYKSPIERLIEINPLVGELINKMGLEAC